MEGWAKANQGWQAVLDLGTNTFQLCIGRRKLNQLEIGLRKKTGVGMGKKGIADGIIQPVVFEKCLETLLDFKADIERAGLHPGKTKAIGTSAFRSLKEPEKWLSIIRETTGFEVEIISGIRESELIFSGVQASGVLKEGLHQLVIDIGGGSVELIHCLGNQPLWKRSFEIGGIRLREKFHLHEPILPQEKENLIQYLTEQLSPFWAHFSNHPPPVLIGCSGSFDTLIDMMHFGQSDIKAEEFPFHSLPIPEFEKLTRKLVKANLEQRLEMGGMIPLRAEMMVVAVILIQLIIKKLQCPLLFTSSFSLKEGFLWTQTEL